MCFTELKRRRLPADRIFEPPILKRGMFFPVTRIIARSRVHISRGTGFTSFPVPPPMRTMRKVDREEFETDRATNSQSPDLHKGGWIKMGAIQAFPTCFHLGHDRVVEDIIIFNTRDLIERR